MTHITALSVSTGRSSPAWTPRSSMLRNRRIPRLTLRTECQPRGRALARSRAAALRSAKFGARWED